MLFQNVWSRCSVVSQNPASMPPPGHLNGRVCTATSNESRLHSIHGYFFRSNKYVQISFLFYLNMFWTDVSQFITRWPSNFFGAIFNSSPMCSFSMHFHLNRLRKTLINKLLYRYERSFRACFFVLYLFWNKCLFRFTLFSNVQIHDDRFQRFQMQCRMFPFRLFLIKTGTTRLQSFESFYTFFYSG